MQFSIPIIFAVLRDKWVSGLEFGRDLLVLEVMISVGGGDDGGDVGTGGGVDVLMCGDAVDIGGSGVVMEEVGGL